MGRALSRRKRRAEDGAAAVEFALVLPLLVAMLFGIMTYGYMFSVRQAVTQAAAEGARAAAVTAATGDPVERAKAAVDRSLSSYGVTCGHGANCEAISTAACAGNASAQCVTVTVVVDYQAHDPFKLLPVPNDLTFTSNAEIN